MLYRMRRAPRIQSTLTESNYRRDLVRDAWSTLARAANQSPDRNAKETTDEPQSTQEDVRPSG